MRTKTLGAGIAAVMVITGLIVIGSALFTITQVGGIEETWRTSDMGTATKIALLSEMRGAIKAVIAGAIDIGLSSSPLKSKKREADSAAAIFARTPFVLVTSRTEEETRMTTSDLIYIYSGIQTTWPDGAPIRLVLRPESDSDWDVLARISPEFERSLVEAASRRGLPVGFTDQEAMTMVEKLPSGLGTASLTAVIAEKRALRAITIDGVAPTLDNLANGSHPLEKSLYLVTRTSPRDLARRFIAFLRSEEGARMLTETGNLMVASANSD